MIEFVVDLFKVMYVWAVIYFTYESAWAVIFFTYDGVFAVLRILCNFVIGLFA